MLENHLVDKSTMRYYPKTTDNFMGYYQGNLIIPFNLEFVKKCKNYWDKEHYSDIIITKSYPLYKTYIRKGTELIGQGESLGYIVYFSGKAYRGCGAIGSSFNRTKGIGLILSKNEMYTEMLNVGLLEKTKKLRFRNLNGNQYILVCNIDNKVYDDGSISNNLSIGLLNDVGDYKDLIQNWSNCITGNLK